MTQEEKKPIDNILYAATCGIKNTVIMTKEEKQLLLKDLCARLPYGVKVWYKYYPINITEKFATSIRLSDNKIALSSKFTKEGDWYPIEEAGEILIKPYLRPMSSMTEDEREEIEVFIFNEWYQEDSCKIDKEGWIEILANYDVSGIDPCFCSDYVDFLLSRHLDFRGLIPMGLALEATEDMYETE